MHALGRYLTEQLEVRGWRAADLARASGVSPQTLSNLMAEGADHLGRMLEHRTITGLAEALVVPEADIVTKAAESMGIGFERLQGMLTDPRLIPDEVLIELLRKRLAEGGGTSAKPRHESPARPEGES